MYIQADLKTKKAGYVIHQLGAKNSRNFRSQYGIAG